MIICGVDAGGTNTKCALINEKGVLLAESKTGPGNCQVTDISNVIQEIKKALNVVCKKVGINEIDILGIGMAEIGCQEDIRRVKNNLLPLSQVGNCFITFFLTNLKKPKL